MDWNTPGFPVHHQLPEVDQTHIHRVGDAIQLSHQLLSPSPCAFNLSSIRVFSSESVLCIRWPKYWSFSYSINSCNEYSGLISFRTDWFDLLAVQRTLKSLFQYHSSKASIFQCSAFFIVQLFCWQSNVSAFNMLSRLVITFLPRSKCLLISWVQSPSAAILEPPK